MNPITRHRLFTPSRKELAAALGVSLAYVSALRLQGLPAFCTIPEAREWMEAHPEATFARAYRPIKFAPYVSPLKFAPAAAPQTPANTARVYSPI
jgi:hypothetical protein